MLIRNSIVEVDSVEELEVVKHPDTQQWTVRYEAEPNEPEVESELDIHKKIVELSDDIRNPMWERDCPLCGTHLYKAVAATPIACHCGAFIWR